MAQFWITIEQDGAVGTHTVNVYMDGSVTPTTFHVTSNADNTSTLTNDAWLSMGLNADALFGVFDLDFFAYQLGVIRPVTAGVDGDYNNNGVVDGADYVLWRKDVTPLINEVNGVTPGNTTEEDYVAWRERFGNSMSGSGSVADLGNSPVPEPPTSWLVVLAAMALILRRGATFSEWFRNTLVII